MDCKSCLDWAIYNVKGRTRSELVYLYDKGQGELIKGWVYGVMEKDSD
jgi:hypothetical protein